MFMWQGKAGHIAYRFGCLICGQVGQEVLCDDCVNDGADVMAWLYSPTELLPSTLPAYIHVDDLETLYPHLLPEHKAQLIASQETLICKQKVLTPELMTKLQANNLQGTTMVRYVISEPDEKPIELIKNPVEVDLVRMLFRE